VRPILVYRSISDSIYRYLYFFEKGCSAITPEVLQGLLQLINDESGGSAGRVSRPPPFRCANVSSYSNRQAFLQVHAGAYQKPEKRRRRRLTAV